MGEEKEEWVGLYFRLPKSLKEEFLEAVAKTYGYEKGNVGQCLRDLITDFVNYVNMTTTTTPANARLKTIATVLEKLPDTKTYTYDYSTITKGVWKTYEDMLSVMWAKWGRYPDQINKRDFYAILATVRGQSRTTLTRWKKELKKAGLIYESRRTIKIYYPVIYDIIDFYSIPPEVFDHFHFAMLSPDGDDLILVYAPTIKMNPDHVAVISVRVTPKKATLMGMAFTPEDEYKRFIRALQEKDIYPGNVPLYRVLTALHAKDNFTPLDFAYLPQLSEYLETRLNVPSARLLPYVPMTTAEKMTKAKQIANTTKKTV